MTDTTRPFDAPVNETASDPATTGPAAGPRVRWGAIVWGLAFAAIAAVELWILVDPGRRLAATDWFASLSGVTATLVAVLAVGTLLLVAGVAGLARRLSRRAAPGE